MRRQLYFNTLIIVLAYHSTISIAYAGTTWFVDANMGSNGDGTSWCSAFLDLQDALAASIAGDDIYVADGTYRPDSGNGDRLASFILPSQVRLFGGFSGCGAINPDSRNFSDTPSILSGDLANNDGPDFSNNNENSFHVVHYSDPSATGVVLDGFTVTAGNANGTHEARTNQGSGIHIRNNGINCIPNGPTISNCNHSQQLGSESWSDKRSLYQYGD